MFPCAIGLAPGGPHEQWPSDTTNPTLATSAPSLTSVTLNRIGGPPSLTLVSPSAVMVDVIPAAAALVGDGGACGATETDAGRVSEDESGAGVAVPELVGGPACE